MQKFKVSLHIEALQSQKPTPSFLIKFTFRSESATRPVFTLYKIYSASSSPNENIQEVSNASRHVLKIESIILKDLFDLGG
jgi:hypothetical protein